MIETLHFSYKSPENLVRLLCNIQYEQTHSPRDITIYHQRFDKESDEIFYQFMIKLYPNGTTINVKEIQEICNYIDYFLDNDDTTKDLKVVYDLEYYSSYVYFDIDKKVYPCDYASHQQMVKKICMDYFKGFDKTDLTVDKISDFIETHFIVKSRFSSAQTIARDSQYILSCILFDLDDESEDTQ